MAESGIGFRMFNCVASRNFDIESGSAEMLFIGCRFRFRSAFNSYSVACEAFSEQLIRPRFLCQFGVEIKLL